MPQITALMPEQLAAARRPNRSRAEVLRQATEARSEDREDLRIVIERLQDPNDPGHSLPRGKMP